MNKNKIILCLLIHILILSLIINSVNAFFGFYEDNEEFNALSNPTAEDLKKISSPTSTDFEHLLETNPQEASLYLVGSTYDEEFAERYIQERGLSNPSVSDAWIAEKFFSENPDFITEYPLSFSSYMSSKGVAISFGPNADISSYSSDGTITTANSRINIKQFAEDYSFKVNDNGKISLIPKGSSREYEFTGTVKKTPQNKIQIMGDGSIAGFNTKDVYHLWIDSSGNINVVASSFGGMNFDQPGLVTCNPSLPLLDGKRKFIFKGSQIKGTAHTLSGDIYFDSKSKKYYAGEGVLTVDNLKVRRTQGNLVEIEVYDPHWYDNAESFVRSALGQDGNGQRTRVSFDEDDGAVNLESQEGDIYSVSFSQDTMQDQADAVNPNQLTLPARGYYKLGDKGEGVRTIQKLMGFRDEQLTGVYDEKTIAAVKYFQSKNINSGLKPDGIWGKKTRDVYLSNPQEEASSEVTLTMEGGVARVGTVNEGLSVDVAGPVALNYKGTEYELKNSVIDAQLGNDLSQTAALTLTTYNNDGEPVATVDRNGLQYVVHEGATPALTAVEQGFINGEFNLYDAVGAHVPLLREKGDNCAGYISTAISLFDGTNGLLSLSDYATYTGSPSASPISLSVAFGVFGNTWDFENNVVAGGGKVIFDKRVTLLTSEEREQLNVIDERIREINGPVYGSSLQRKHNAIMGDQVAYSNNNFLPGDVIVMYYGTTKSLNKAVAAGEDSTHSGVVFGNRVEYATYHAETQPTNLRDFVSETTGVNNPTLLSNYPIQVMSGDNQQWKKVKLASDGNYYFIEFVDKNTNVPIPGAQEVVLSEDTQVSVEKTYITDNVHGTMGTYDLNRYLNDNPHISLSEHLRPNEEVMAAVRDKQLDEEFDAVQVTADLYNAPNTYAAIIAQTGADETVAPLLLNRMTQEDKLRRSGILAKGDIILVPANPVNPATTEATGIERVSLWAQDVISEVEDVIS